MFPFYACLARYRALFFFLLLLPGMARAQGPAWQTVVALNSVAPQEAIVAASALDASGNVYLVGQFSGTLRLGTLGISSVGGYDGFIAKYNPVTATFLWAQRCGGSGNEGLGAVAVSGSSVYVSGLLVGATATIGATTLTNTTAGQGFFDSFVAKLTDAGTSASFAWAQQVSGSRHDFVTGLAATPTGVYVAGYYDSPSLALGTTVLPNPVPFFGGNGNGYVAKLTDAGNSASVAWALPVQGDNSESVEALTATGTAVYIGGHVNGTSVQIGNTTVATTTQKSFIAKLTDTVTPAGATWVLPLNTPVKPSALTVSGSNVYVAGQFDGPSVVVGTTTLTNADNRTTSTSDDIFVAKLTDGGSAASVTWAVQAGGPYSDAVRAIAVNGAHVYIVGDFGSPNATFGSTTLFNTLSPNPNDVDSEVYVAKLRDGGATAGFEWAQQSTGVGLDFGSALAVRGSMVYVGGYVVGNPSTFGTLTVANPGGTAVAFLASLTDPALTATAGSRALAPAQFYPNPAHHTATLRLPAGTAPAPLTLTDEMGRAVRAFSAPTGPETVLDLRGLPAGFYLLRGAGVAQRLVVE